MILADKIIKLRKQCGWSQEELAEKMNVSRQSISKWEGATSIPDLNKIIQLSQIFGVSTDFLLKDEMEVEEFTGNSDEEGFPLINLKAATDYMDSLHQAAKLISRGVLLCIYGIIPMLFMVGFSELEESNLDENLAAGLGVIILLMIVAVAVSFFVGSTRYTRDHEKFNTGKFELEYGVKSILKEQAEVYHSAFYSKLSLCIGMYIVSVIPVVMAGILDVPEGYTIFTVVALLAIVGAATYFLIPLVFKKGAFDRLLGEGEFNPKFRKENEQVEKFAGIYWPLVVAVYLGWSFFTMDWYITWVVWPVAGLVFAGLSGFFRK